MSHSEREVFAQRSGVLEPLLDTRMYNLHANYLSHQKLSQLIFGTESPLY